MEISIEEALFKLDSVLENAICEYDVACLCEAAQGTEQAVEETNKKKAVVSYIFKKIVNKLKALIDLVITKLTELIGGKIEDVVVKAGVPEGTVNPTLLKKYATEGSAAIALKNYDKIPSSDEVSTPTTKDVKLNFVEARNTLGFVKQCIDKCNKSLADQDDVEGCDNARLYLTSLGMITAAMNANLDTLIRIDTKDASDDEKNSNKYMNNKLRVVGERAEKKGEKEFRKMSESGRDKYKEKLEREGATNESISLKARMAELLQEAAEILDEEKPVEGNEYDPSVNGSEGEKPDLEEVKDLLNNDSKAVGIVTHEGDEGESVAIHFDEE